MDRKYNINELAKRLEKINFIEFAFIFGSAQDGIIKENSDLDLAVYFNDEVKIGFDEIAEILQTVEEIVPGVDSDLCRLNTAGEILKMEALKGKLLFVRNMEKYAEFYSRACAEYEDSIFWMDRQLQYRRVLK